MKTKNVKKLTLIVLSVIFVLSTMVLSAYAIPIDYKVANSNHLINTFDGDNVKMTEIIVADTAYPELVTGEKSHSGTGSIKFTASSSNIANCYIRPDKANNNAFFFEKGKKYYVSFWTYSDTNKVNINAALTYPFGVSKTDNPFKSSSTEVSKWNKHWVTFETSAETTNSDKFIKLCFYNLPQGEVVYLDDLEIAEITDSSVTADSVPASAAVAKKAHLDGTATTKGDSTLFYNYGLTVPTISHDNANFGHASYKTVYKTAGEALNGDLWFYPATLLGESLVNDTPYYASFYIYVPGDKADVTFTTRGSQTIISKRTIPANKWVKVSGLVTINTGTSNYSIWDINIKNTTAKEAYIDDIVVARLTSQPANASLTISDVDVNKFGAGNLTLTSTIELDEASLSTSCFAFSGDGAVNDVTLIDEKTAYVSFDLGNAESDTLTVNLNDAYNRAVSTTTVVNNNANVLATINSDTSFEGKQFYKVSSENTAVSTTSGQEHYTSSGEAHSGTVSVAMKYDGTKSNQWIYKNTYYSGGWVTDFTLESGNKYYYEFYAKISDAATTAECTLSTVVNGAYTAGNTTATINKSGWTKVRNVLDFSKTSDSITQQILINLSGLQTDEIVYMDDFKIYEIPEGQEYAGNFHVAGGDAVINGDMAKASLTLTNTYFDKETIPVRVILATYNGDTLVDADVVDKNLGFGDVEEFELSADKGTTSKIFVWKWDTLTPLTK